MQPNEPYGLSKAEVIKHLTACLALVRPVGMNDDMATEWLAVAANEVLGFAEQRPEQFMSACGRVRRECTHHGQIVPNILKGARCEWERQNEPFLTRAQIAEKQRRLELPKGEARLLIEGAAKTLRRV